MQEHGHLEDVDLAGAARGLGNLRHRLAEERVEHAALADVRTPEEGDLRQVRLRFKQHQHQHQHPRKNEQQHAPQKQPQQQEQAVPG